MQSNHIVQYRFKLSFVQYDLNRYTTTTKLLLNFVLRFESRLSLLKQERSSVILDLVQAARTSGAGVRSTSERRGVQNATHRPRP